ncbi:MAG: cupin domain-containing protein [Candidatus Aminicenantes bacterium]|nr:cupin domain-containing protein [Candidatus Aminicenantes bacterium]MDH5466273.1 cupin domain-containing protein [Candidatus Aminicenantes bacterium]MDH5705289.1 cupin domain-containing protein [Candidatus Aminicenantes bacterium]
MVIKKNIEVKEAPVTEEEVKNVTRKILIGPDDGSHNIIMRLFKVLPGGHTPLHNHSHEHVVQVEKGRGVVVAGTGEEVEVSQGQSLLVEGDEKHQFKNPFSEPFEFLCIILNPDR